MRVDSALRVMWLLNHTSARKFELSMLKAVGVQEIFTPKLHPQDIRFRSSSIDYSEDQNLTIPTEVLNRFNQINWYESASTEDWELASDYFDICFFILHDLGSFKAMAQHFRGALVWRAYGLEKTTNYSRIMQGFTAGLGEIWVKNIGGRFFFGQAYPNLADGESSWLARRALYLPLGMPDTSRIGSWTGSDPRIFFICPGIAHNPYYKKIYSDFLANFGDFPYAIGGEQPISVQDPNVLGFVPAERHAQNMREMRLMFYHSQEPNHLHYHPLEAVRAGMPLIFMAGGMLDQLGGTALPGRCETVKEARKKIKRILDGDQKFISEIRTKQAVLLNALEPQTLAETWKSNFPLIRRSLDPTHQYITTPPRRRNRIAVILPLGYKGGTLRGVQLIAEAIREGAECLGDPIDVTLIHLEDAGYTVEDFSELHPGIKRRTFSWQYLDADAARRAMRFAGYSDWQPSAARYAVVNDGIRQLADCDLWLVVSDRITVPLLPLRPIVHVVYDYLQRYYKFLDERNNQQFLNAARGAERVLVTTDFTYRDTVQYAGVDPKKVVKLPMLSPNLRVHQQVSRDTASDYFIWTTNAGVHKNHINAFQALTYYYSQHGGALRCVVTGVGSANLLSSPPAHMRKTARLLKSDKDLLEKVVFRGNIPDHEYRSLLAGAAFLWHPGSIDNGTFSVLEAAGVGIPSLSSDYPAMREIDKQFEVGLHWMDSTDPSSMAMALKRMEQNHFSVNRFQRHTLVLKQQDTRQHSMEYWKAIRECL